MSLTATAEHLIFVDTQVLDQDFAVTGTAMHSFDLANLVPTIRWDIDDERRIGGLGNVRVLFGTTNQDGEVGPVGIGDEPFMAIDDPLVAIFVGVGLDEGWV